MGGVPYQSLLLLQFFAYNICAHEKVRTGEGELIYISDADI